MLDFGKRELAVLNSFLVLELGQAFEAEIVVSSKDMEDGEYGRNLKKREVGRS